MFKIGDLVFIKDEKDKVIYIISSIEQEFALLKGYSHRIIRKCPLSNLALASQTDASKEDLESKRTLTRLKRIKKERIFKRAIFGTVLHIDGDVDFLNSCINLYEELGIKAWGLHLSEKELKTYILPAIKQVTPDIVVMTGHDYYNGKDKKDLNNYENSKEFIEAIRIIRQNYYANSIIIIAGACGSHFEALIAAGANFASSPKRINVHTYDPAVIAIKCATTPFSQYINFDSTIKYIENAKDAYGGVETNGKMKLLL